MKIDILNIVEQADGSAVVIADLDNEAIMILAEIGFNKLMADAAERAIKEKAQSDGHSDPEGEGDDQAGEGGDKPLP